MKRFTTKRLVICSILISIALTIFVLEAQIPLPIAIPGLKLGLSNIVTLFALVYLSPKEAFLILVSRILLGSFFVGSPASLIYSLSGGIICLLTETLIFKHIGKKFVIEISVIGAMVHITTQILCAIIITRTTAIFYYLPILLIPSMITGAFCGICVKLMDKNLKNR